MGKFIKIYAAKNPSHKRVLFRYGEKRLWRFPQNWKCNFSRAGSPQKVFFCNVLTPFLRLTVCNGKTEFGLGNHYFEFGYSPSR